MFSLLAVWGLAGSVRSLPGLGTVLAAESDPHAYFDKLTARPEIWKAYSLRDPKQLDYPKNGGMADGNSGGLWVTYNPAGDADVHAQDAAKIVIPAWTDLGGSLSAAVNSSDVVLHITGLTGTYQPPRSVIIDSEIVTATNIDVTAGTLTVKRAQFGTAAAAHSAASHVKVAGNSLANMLRIPLGTTDGHKYFFTWDAYWTDSYLHTGLDGHKTFQFTNGGDNVWLELRALYSGGTGASTAFRPTTFNSATDVAAIDVRSYNQYWSSDPGWLPTWSNWLLTDGNQLGPGTTQRDALAPGTGRTFTIKPNRWTRFFVQIEQRANDYDYMDLWVADELTAPVQIYSRIPVSVRPTGMMKGNNSIQSFWFEFNTSTPTFARGTNRDLVSYVRNFAVLRDVSDVRSLLVSPALGAVSQTSAPPAAPTNVRIVS